MHLDYISAILSLPLLVMALIINFTNLRKNSSPVLTPTPIPTISESAPKKRPPEITQTVQSITSTPAVTSSVCQKSIGPISISYPLEGATLSDNPVCISIDYSDTSYCSVIWSYKINNGTWSDYNNDRLCIYNLPAGNVNFQLRVVSTVSNDTKTLTRNFQYNGTTVSVPSSTPAPTVTPVALTPTSTASSSASALN